MKAPVPALLAALLLGVSCSRAPDIKPPASDFEVRATLSTNRVVIGEVAELFVEVFHPEGTAVQVPSADRPPEIVLKDRDTQTRPYRPGTLRTVERSRFASLRPGRHAVATGEVARVAVTAGVSTNAPMPALEIEVRPVLPDMGGTLTRAGEELAKASTTNSVAPARIMPARSAFHTPVDSEKKRLMMLLWFVLALALVLALAGWIMQRVAYRRRHPAPPTPPPPPHLVALGELEALKASGLIERGEAEPFFVGISGILRRYVEGRFHLRAPEMTTEEFIEAAATAPDLAPAHQGLMREFLTRCDLVKFARHLPAPAALGEAHETGVRFVRESAPPDTPGEGA